MTETLGTEAIERCLDALDARRTHTNGTVEQAHAELAVLKAGVGQYPPVQVAIARLIPWLTHGVSCNNHGCKCGLDERIMELASPAPVSTPADDKDSCDLCGKASGFDDILLCGDCYARECKAKPTHTKVIPAEEGYTRYPNTTDDYAATVPAPPVDAFKEQGAVIRSAVQGVEIEELKRHIKLLADLVLNRKYHSEETDYKNGCDCKACVTVRAARKVASGE